MESLCSGPFWDSNLTWYNNSWPHLTECFQNTALTWIPCAYLLLVTPAYIPYLVACTLASHRRLTWLFILKQVSTALMIVLLLVELILASAKASFFDEAILSHTSWIAVMILHIFLVSLERTRDIHRFPVLFVFWILGSAVLLIQLYSAIQNEIHHTAIADFSLLTARYLLSCAIFVLFCFPDYRKEDFEKNSSPFMTASMPSLLLFLWMERLIFKGLKKPLQEEDIYNLPPQNTSLHVMGKFHKTWEKHQNRYGLLTSKRAQKTRKNRNVYQVDWCEIPLQSKTIQEEPKALNEPEEISPSSKASFGNALIWNFLPEMLLSQVGQLGRFVDEATSPLLLGLFIDYISNQELTWHGFVYTTGILMLKMLATVTTYPSYYAVSRMALRLQTASMGSVFRKALTVSSEARKESTSGEIINLMSVDSTNFRIFADYSFWMWTCILYFTVGISFTSAAMGLAILPGLAFILLLLLMNIFVLHKLTVYEEDKMQIKDERVKIMNEVLNGIKVIKLYGWESTFMKKIINVREKELQVVLKISIFEALFHFAWCGTLFWMIHFILVTFVLTSEDHHLDANTAFVTLSYLNLVQLAVNILPIIAQDGVKAKTSLKRMNKFMNAKDISVDNLERDESDPLPVRIADADFSWERHGSVILKGVSIEVECGKLIAVVGTVGSGKSSLLSAMLGEMHKIRGQVNLNSSVAYVPQQAWIQNATVRDNILFGSPYKSDFYSTVIKNCCLEPDLEMMAAGDQTEIGEKGINLSGGQKQRVSLARAVYSQADIYLLDDPLSAVDSHVGRHIFDQVIGPTGCLQGKTRVLVTHGVQWLPDVDEIFVLTHGEISESGTFDELLAQNGDFSQFLTQYFVQHSDSKLKEEEDISADGIMKKDVLQRLVSVTSDSDASEIKDSVELHRFLSVESAAKRTNVFGSSSVLNHRHDIRISHSSLHGINCDEDDPRSFDDAIADQAAASKLTTTEEAAGGRVSLKNYWHLWRGVGSIYTFIIAVFVLGYHVVYNFANYWIAEWNDDLDLSNFTEFPANSTARLDRNTYYIVTYTVIGVIQSVCVLVYSFVLHIRHVEASRILHAELMDSVIKAPMSFFDTTPMGRILNRFSQDIEVIDNEIFFTMMDSTEHGLKAVGILLMISFTLPWFLVVVLPLLLLIFLVQKMFVLNSCQCRRITSNKRSPIFAHFSETLSGATVIRAYRAQDRFIQDSNHKIDECQKANLAAKGCNRWMLSRLDIVSYLVIGSVCIFAVVMRDDLTPGVIGLAVSYAFTISIELCLTVEQLGMLETHTVSVERVRDYSVIKSEAPWTEPDDSETTSSSSGQWPAVGIIQFGNYSTRYREGMDMVLKDITCTIRGGEKVGIVGRTGAGKSSMVLSLFRLIEAVEGCIIIDGVDISHIGLHTLRHNITILPQDPVLFAGSLRSNVDPQEEKTDSEIWTALEHSHLKKFVLGLDSKLDHEVGEGGGNLSMGQRQLVCLARTLLRKTRILVLDEATAAVDMDTDSLIQNTIRTEFRECTILTIAHRLNTVMDYDRIMVLDNGKIVEFDSPSSLLSSPESVFYTMAKDAGLVGTN